MFRTPLQHNSGRATSLDGNCTCRVGRIQRIFISGQLKVIPLFRYSVIPYSAFYSVPRSIRGQDIHGRALLPQQVVDELQGDDRRWAGLVCRHDV